MAPSASGPYKLVTVNTAPERAKRIIGQLVEALKEEYEIDYVQNCESWYTASLLRSCPDECTGIDEVEDTVKKQQPDVLVGKLVASS